MSRHKSHFAGWQNVCFYIAACAHCLRRGTLGGAEHRNIAKNIDKYRNTAKKICKYRNTALKVDEIPKSQNLVYYLHYAIQLTRIAWFRI